MSASPARVGLHREVDVVRARRAAIRLAGEIGLDQRCRARVDLVVAELAMNVVRHANRGEIVVEPLLGQQGGIRVSCRDSGPGFQVGSPHRGPGSDGLGLGLSVIRELADSVVVDSAPGRGTIVVAEVLR